MEKKIAKEVVMDDDFECECGNVASSYGFYPCDEDGVYCEPELGWSGHYKCDNCKQIYIPKEDKGRE